MDYSTIAAILIFSYTPNTNTVPIQNRTVGVNDLKSCVIVANDMANRFDQQYPGGIFEAQCKDTEYRTYYLIRNKRF